jgi:hypothetical protein
VDQAVGFFIFWPFTDRKRASSDKHALGLVNTAPLIFLAGNLPRSTDSKSFFLLSATADSETVEDLSRPKSPSGIAASLQSAGLFAVVMLN